MADLVPTNALRNIYANPPQKTQTQTHELDDLDGRSMQTGPLPTDPGQHTKTDFVLGRSAIISIIVITIIIIVLIIVVVVKAGQIAKKNAREKKEKLEREKAMGIVSGAVRQYTGGAGIAAVGLSCIVQVLLL